MASPLGIKLSYFHRFIALHGGREAFQGLTTAQVCFQYVVPYTEPSQLSLVDHVRLNTQDRDFVQIANWYVSHAWIYLFLETIESLESFFKRMNIEDPVVWFCVFNNNQHQVDEHPFEWWQSTFKDSLAAIGNVVMIMHPWKNPITLTRSWCVFELYVSIVVGATFELAMAANQEEILFQDTLDDMGEFLAVLGSVNSEKAMATVATDKENIDRVIICEVGFMELDRMVFDRFKQWMINAIQIRMEKASGPLEIAKYNYSMAEFLGVQGNLVQGIRFGEIALKIYSTELGEKSFEALRSKAQLAMYYGCHDTPRSVWETMLLDAISDLTIVAGRDHFITISALHQLGQLYVNLDELEVGINLLLEVKELMLLHYGSEHKYFLTLGNELDIALAQYGEELLGENTNAQHAHTILAKNLGDNHPFTLMALENVALVCQENEEFIKAIELQTEIYEKTLRNFGPNATESLQKLNMLAMVYIKAKYFDIALEKLESCIAIASKSLSPDSIAIVQALSSMGMAYVGLNQYELACTCLFDALVRWETQDIKTFRDESLYVLFDCHERLNIVYDLNVINQLIKWLHDTDQWNETRMFSACTLCSIPELYGTIYLCPQCPLNQIRVCAACFEIVPSCVECGYVLKESIPPPRRLLQLKINLLGEFGDNDGAKATSKELQEYCKNSNIILPDSKEVLSSTETQDETLNEKSSTELTSYAILND
ncbi:mbre TPR repeat protein [Thraustotheca clavata]|uniref:Mbre TPR repeat protein n=1 Tax=Thraustotheca clavata TaxID=74557 RepID=A0A1V9ZXR7_9STRA|nr:mbre TPR repeat protein [Thraustotheca clavata]